MFEQIVGAEAPSTNGESKPPLPPTVTIVKTPDGCTIGHNIIDPWLVLALIEMGKDALLVEMKRGKLIKPPTGGIANFARNLRGGH